MKKNIIKERLLKEICDVILRNERIDEKYIKLIVLMDDLSLSNIFQYLDENDIKYNKEEIIHYITNELIETGNSKYILLFSKNENSILPIDLLSNAILRISNRENVCKFAAQVKGINASKFLYYIENFGTPEDVYDFIVNTFIEKFNILDATINKEKTFSDLVKIIINAYESRLLYKMAINKKIDKLQYEILEDALLNCGNAAYYYWVAQNSKYANINKLQDALIKTKNLEFMRDFARYIKGADKEKLFERVLEIDDYFAFYNFLKEVPNIKKEKIVDAVINTNNIMFLFENKINLSKKLVDKLVNAVLESNYCYLAYEFACYIEGAPIDKLADKIIEFGDFKYIKWFIENVPNAPIEKLVKAIVRLGCPENIYDIAKIVKDKKCIDILTDAIIEIGDICYMYDFARYIGGNSTEKIFKAIKELKD